jgi:hypothetical protein
MIESADEFVRMRGSSDLCEQRKAAHAEASMEIWLDRMVPVPLSRCWEVYPLS